MSNQNWIPISLAPEDELVATRCYEGGKSWNEQCLRRKGKLWFFPDSSAYVYYEPTEYRELNAEEQAIEDKRLRYVAHCAAFKG